MTLATKTRRYWTCPKCSHRNEATRSRKCQNPECRELSRPKKRVPVHARTLRDDSYETYARLNFAIHAKATHFLFDAESCGLCGKPKPERRRHDRDHDHRTGQARGLACVRCNRELLRHATLEEARAVVAYLERVQAYYSQQDARPQAGDVHAL